MIDLRIAVLGGTFDPVHMGHVKMAKDAIEEFNLDKLIVVPNGNPPHKMDSEQADFNHRFNMLEIAFKGMDKVHISDYEASENTPSYSLYSMRHFRSLYGEDTAFIIGADSLFTIHKWYEYEKLLSENTFIVFRRIGNGNLSDTVEKYKKCYGAKILISDMDYVDISSTDIRNAIAENTFSGDVIPAGVEEYIRKNGLYGGKNG